MYAIKIHLASNVLDESLKYLEKQSPSHLIATKNRKAQKDDYKLVAIGSALMCHFSNVFLLCGRQKRSIKFGRYVNFEMTCFVD